MLRAGVRTADKGIEPGNAMHQSLRLKKIERPVDGHGCGFRPFGSELFEDCVGPDGGVPCPDYLQHPLSLRGEPDPRSAAVLFGARHGLGDATLVIVPRREEIDGLIHLGRDG